MKPLNTRLGYFQRRMAAQKTVTQPLHPLKGMKGGACNRTACQRPAAQDRDGIRWFNHSTRRYYCFACAWDLNEDLFNKRDAHELWGHNLCTLESA